MMKMEESLLYKGKKPSIKSTLNRLTINVPKLQSTIVEPEGFHKPISKMISPKIH